MYVEVEEKKKGLKLIKSFSLEDKKYEKLIERWVWNWEINWRERHSNSVTRFGEIPPLRQICKNIWQ